MGCLVHLQAAELLEHQTDTSRLHLLAELLLGAGHTGRVSFNSKIVNNAAY